MKFKESELAHKLLDGLRGCEIGGSSHNPFCLNTINVGRSTEGTDYAKAEIKLAGEALPIDVVCEGDALPFGDGEYDFVISSHVLEHFYDPIKTAKEWMRVIRPGGYVFVIFPHKERTFDKDLPRTMLSDLIARHNEPPTPKEDKHWTIWVLEDALEFCRYLGLNVVATEDPDGKVGNGFTFVIQK